MCPCLKRPGKSLGLAKAWLTTAETAAYSLLRQVLDFGPFWAVVDSDTFPVEQLSLTLYFVPHILPWLYIPQLSLHLRAESRQQPGGLPH